MLEKCAGCGGRILAGGLGWRDMRFCGEPCRSRFKAKLVDETVPAEVILERVAAVFASRCPECGETRGNDLYSATKVTGMLFAYEIQSESVLCCSACGRENRLLAALHCLFFGWWSIRAAFINVFVLPTNLFCCLFIRQPRSPSPTLAAFVKVQMADAMLHDLAASDDARIQSSWELKRLEKRVAILQQLASSEGSNESAKQLLDSTGKTATEYLDQSIMSLQTYAERATNEREKALATDLLHSARSLERQIRSG